MPDPNNEKSTPASPQPTNDLSDPGKWLLAALLLLLIVLGLDAITADIWFDEFLTLHLFVLPQPGNISYVFTHYPIANNHILFSFLLRLWFGFFSSFFSNDALRTAQWIFSETAIRFPCLVLACASVAVVFQQGRRLFSRNAGTYLALLLLISPIFLNFTFQARGYALSFFLSTLATVGAMELATGGNTRRGLGFFVPAAVLLPMVIPSNILTTLALFSFIALTYPRFSRDSKFKKTISLILSGIAATIGMGIYLPILPAFLRVMRQTDGWAAAGASASIRTAAGLKVLGNWAWALAAQSGLFVIACLGLRRQPDIPTPPPDSAKTATHEPPSPRSVLPLLLICCLIPIILVALLRAPFPRSFLGFLPPLVFASLIAYHDYLVILPKYRYLLTFFILCNGAVWNRMDPYLTERELFAGRMPQNLMLQYYARNHDWSLAARVLAKSPSLPPNLRIFVPFHFYLSFLHYWSLDMRRNPQQVECLGGGNSPLYKLKHKKDFYSRVPQAVLAYSQKQAEQLYRQTVGGTFRLRPIQNLGRLTLYQILPDKPSKLKLPPIPKNGISI